MGETEITSMIDDINRVACAPVYISRTMARGMTITVAPPMPCTRRPKTSVSISGATAQITAPTQKMLIPMARVFLRPIWSDSGP